MKAYKACQNICSKLYHWKGSQTVLSLIFSCRVLQFWKTEYKQQYLRDNIIQAQTISFMVFNWTIPDGTERYFLSYS